MPGKSYNNPQLEYERNKRVVAADAARQKTEREKAIAQAEVAKKAAALNDQIEANENQIKKLKVVIQNTEKIKAVDVSSYNNLYRTFISPSSAGGTTITTAEQNNLNTVQSQITQSENVISTTKTNIKNLTDKNNALKKQWNQLYNIKAQSNFSITANKTQSSTKKDLPKEDPKTQGTEGPVKPSDGWKYNLPLILPARFLESPTAPLISSLGDNSGLAGTPTTNRVKKDYWEDDKPGRGVLRVNKKFLKDMLATTSYRDIIAKGGRVDPQLYGFRFLYNPSQITMQYSNNENINPAVLAEGPIMVDPFVNNVVIAMDLILNRMEDMKYREIPNEAISRGVYGKIGATQSLLPEVREIHERGTMYDLEYLFKTYHTPLGTFDSLYNGKTADRGFVQPTIIELHLGKSLRYPGRIISLTVEHKIFDPRMVPIYSVVRLVLGRIHDYGTGKKTTGGGGGLRGEAQIL